MRLFLLCFVFFTTISSCKQRQELASEPLNSEESSNSSSGLGLYGPRIFVGELPKETRLLAKEAIKNRIKSVNVLGKKLENVSHKTVIKPHIEIDECLLNLNYLYKKNGPFHIVAKHEDEALEIVSEAERHGLDAKIIPHNNLHENKAIFSIVEINKPEKGVAVVDTSEAASLYIKIKNDVKARTSIYEASDANGIVGNILVEKGPKQGNYETEEFTIAMKDHSQGKGYGRELLERVLSLYTNQYKNVYLNDASKMGIGRTLYGGQKTLEKFDIFVKFRGGRQEYIITKKNGAIGVKFYLKRSNDIIEDGAVQAIRRDYNGIPGDSGVASVQDLVEYLTQHKGQILDLRNSDKFMRQLGSSITKAKEKNYVEFLDELLKLEKMVKGD